MQNNVFNFKTFCFFGRPYLFMLVLSLKLVGFLTYFDVFLNLQTVFFRLLDLFLLFYYFWTFIIILFIMINILFTCLHMDVEQYSVRQLFINTLNNINIFLTTLLYFLGTDVDYDLYPHIVYAVNRLILVDIEN